MRSLIKNDPGIQYIDEQTIQRVRRRRRALRLLLAFSCIGVAGFCLFLLLRLSGNDLTSGPAMSLSEPGSVITWLRWTVNAFTVQIRATVSSALASGYVATILKLVLCFGLGAVFLRMPQRY